MHHINLEHTFDLEKKTRKFCMNQHRILVESPCNCMPIDDDDGFVSFVKLKLET